MRLFLIGNRLTLEGQHMLLLLKTFLEETLEILLIWTLFPTYHRLLSKPTCNNLTTQSLFQISRRTWSLHQLLQPRHKNCQFHHRGLRKNLFQFTIKNNPNKKWPRNKPRKMWILNKNRLQRNQNKIMSIPIKLFRFKNESRRNQVILFKKQRLSRTVLSSIN